jgi:hypothetical protein
VIDDPRVAAWWAVHDAMPPFWRVGPVTYNPGRYAWTVTARAPHPGRGRIPVTLSGTGNDELGALRDLNDRLRGAPRLAEDVARRQALNRKLRFAFYQGAEEEARRRGAALDEPGLDRVLDRYPGDLGEKANGE